MIEISGEYHWLEFELKALAVRGMGFSTWIQYGMAAVNKVNKSLITNLNENTWKLVKPNVISFFN